jgi:lysophospholipid acyltransferase (LPLAT)-like uncharacterized protein
MLFDKRENTAQAKWKLIGWSGKLLIDLLFAGSRIDVQGYAPIARLLASRQFIFACWHSRILLVSYLHKGWDAAIMVSNSADGEIIARVLELQGHTAVRGSTRKGGMRALIKITENIVTHRRPAAVIPDGPQGPRHEVQPGVIVLSKKTGYPIIPVTYSAKYRHQFNSWDRFILPYPCSPCVLKFGHPVKVPAQADAQKLKACQEDLKKELNRITHEADGHFGHFFEP